MSEDHKDAGGRRAGRARGGLGRGLGALIPEVEPEQTTPENPLDVLFPGRDSSASAARERGGSMRDLLSPPGRARNVPRETSARRAPSAGGVGDERDQGTGSHLRDETPAASEGKTWGLFGEDGETPAGTDKANVSRETSEGETDLVDVPGARFASVPVEWIVPNLKQPRSAFEQSELDELASSIGALGVLQPVVVRTLTAEVLEDPDQRARLIEESEKYPEARYELVMGERRWRAATLAGLSTIPAIIRETDPDEMLREALVENLHRVQLNPLEEAAAYSQLIEDFGYTQEELSRAVAKSRPQVANTLRLLNLPPSVAERVAAGVLSAGHARALLGLDSPEAMNDIAERIVREGLSVRATEELVRGASGAKPARRSSSQSSPSRTAVAHAARIAEALDTSVRVTQGKQKGRLVIDYADEDDLSRIVGILLKEASH